MKFVTWIDTPIIGLDRAVIVNTVTHVEDMVIAIAHHTGENVAMNITLIVAL